jgi:hypothetical protein
MFTILALYDRANRIYCLVTDNSNQADSYYGVNRRALCVGH